MRERSECRATHTYHTLAIPYHHVYVRTRVSTNIISKRTRNTSTQVQLGNSWALLSVLKTSRYTTVPTRQRCLQRGSPPHTILASVWACTHNSACIASLRTVSVVVRVCGFHGWSSWLGTRSPGSGAVRVSSQLRAALLTRPPVSSQDKRDEVVLVVGVLRRFDRGVGLPAWCHCPGRHSAGSRTPRPRRGSTCCRAC